RFIASPIMQGLERAGTTARCATALPNGRACSRVVRALSRRKGPQYVLKTGQRKMSEIIDDYEIAFERYGRPKGPFEKGRQCGYSAVATVKPGPAVDQGNQEPPPGTLVGPMSGRNMNWRRARLPGKPSLDHRWENDIPDRADRWLKAVERNRQQRRFTTTASSSSSTIARSSR